MGSPPFQRAKSALYVRANRLPFGYALSQRLYHIKVLQAIKNPAKADVDNFIYSDIIKEMFYLARKKEKTKSAKKRVIALLFIGRGGSMRLQGIPKKKPTKKPLSSWISSNAAKWAYPGI